MSSWILSLTLENVNPVDFRLTVSQILKARNKMRDAVTDMLVDRVCDVANFCYLVDIVHHNLPATVRVKRDVIADSLQHLEGAKLTYEAIHLAAWRICGNLDVISGVRGMSRPIYPWTMQPYDEWVPVQVMAYRPCRTDFDREIGARYTFKVLAGQPCGMNVLQKWGSSRIYAVARDIGFRSASDSLTSTRECVPLSDFSELVTMRFRALVDADRSHTQPVFDHMELNAASVAWNRTQLKHRGRFKPEFYCPKGYSLLKPCHSCHVGYKTCRSATHRLDWVRGPCDVCGNDSWFDHEISKDLCLVCYRKQALARKPK